MRSLKSGAPKLWVEQPGVRAPPARSTAGRWTTPHSVGKARSLIDAATDHGADRSRYLDDSGIPDFRGPNGLWTKNPAAEKASNIQYYVRDPEVRKANWAQRANGELRTSNPTVATERWSN